MMYIQIEAPRGGYLCVVEDDGKTAYAYLLKGHGVLSDLWLYNSIQTPNEPEWSDRTKMPFLNPAEFVDLSKMAQPIRDQDEVELEWSFNEDGSLGSAILWIHGALYGRLVPGATPAWCVAVSKDGPLALKL